MFGMDQESLVGIRKVLNGSGKFKMDLKSLGGIRNGWNGLEKV